MNKKASLVIDDDNENNPQEYGLDHFVKWQDEDL